MESFRGKGRDVIGVAQPQDRFLLAAVLGFPVAQSRSPLLHDYWFAKHGLAGRYLALPVKPGRLEPALRGLAPLGYAGCNLTIPHKQDAMTIVDLVDDVARDIGAISCVVVRPDGMLLGTNNDWRGCMGNLHDAFPDWRADAGPVAVIGAGGGARAVCYGLLRAGVPELRLVNRTQDRAAQIAADLGGRISVIAWEDRVSALDGVTLVVNGTSQGMVGMAPLDLPLDHLPAAAIAYDIIYTPLETPFLATARVQGNATLNGLGMLLHQGVPAWQAWFGITPVVTADLRQRMEHAIAPQAS
jgi:shikimate dehydrogenase